VFGHSNVNIAGIVLGIQDGDPGNVHCAQTLCETENDIGRKLSFQNSCAVNAIRDKNGGNRAGSVALDVTHLLPSTKTSTSALLATLVG